MATPGDTSGNHDSVAKDAFYCSASLLKQLLWKMDSGRPYKKASFMPIWREFTVSKACVSSSGLIIKKGRREFKEVYHICCPPQAFLEWPENLLLSSQGESNLQFESCWSTGKGKWCRCRCWGRNPGVDVLWTMWMGVPSVSCLMESPWNVNWLSRRRIQHTSMWI